ncbi:hypothetical protein KBK19_05515 [Microvirga sp. STR05]|uniref:DUF2490 domain-containing protein n=1 Tax=Hymenobacter duratus TaxID=2771356 RepID=A0ABR8JCH2_9BACT|nr:hypothetical protein [Hymenobacter duratus]MBD2714484.1 hypothetical protein [Hymenobacter duratus]MBR7949388.1 hypothetical protein [Microvirga sp. STR05]
MSYRFCLLLAAVGLLCTTTATAQRRYHRDLIVIPELQAEWALKGNDYLVTSFNLRSLTGPSSPGGTFAGAQLFAGYEHWLSEKWSWGPTLRLQGGDLIGFAGEGLGLAGEISAGALLRHTGTIGSFRFSQRLGVEYSVPLDEYIEDRALSRLRLEVDRLFPLTEKMALRPRIACEAAAYLRFQRDETDLKERVIDYGTLRGEIGWRVSPRFDVTPWLASQTIYYNALPQYNSDGVEVSGGRSNLVGPVAGLDVRFTFLGKNASAERQQLPTQH